jgi:predicted ATP-grasp superfamily ATP-dependent carboligase
MGPLLKGGGAFAFLLDYAFRHSPASFLLFAASDGVLAAITLWLLLVE